MKKEEIVKFTLKLPDDLAQKLSYIGEYYGRSRSSEIIWALRKYVAAFEKQNGEIDVSDAMK